MTSYYGRIVNCAGSLQLLIICHESTVQWFYRGHVFRLMIMTIADWRNHARSWSRLFICEKNIGWLLKIKFEYILHQQFQHIPYFSSLLTNIKKAEYYTFSFQVVETLLEHFCIIKAPNNFTADDLRSLILDFHCITRLGHDWWEI